MKTQEYCWYLSHSEQTLNEENLWIFALAWFRHRNSRENKEQGTTLRLLVLIILLLPFPAASQQQANLNPLTSLEAQFISCFGNVVKNNYSPRTRQIQNNTNKSVMTTLRKGLLSVIFNKKRTKSGFLRVLDSP